MKKCKNLGFTLIETLIALSVFGLLSAGAFDVYQSMLNEQRDQADAQYMTQVGNAATKYVQANINSLTATSSSSQAISISTLSSGGYLPPAFSSATTNSYGQTMCVLILKSTGASQIATALVVTEGGANIPSARISKIASQIGYQGGYFNNANSIQSAFNTWSLSTANITNLTASKCSGTAATTGSLALLVTIDSANLVNNYIYRNTVTNHSEAQVLTSPLIMSAQATANAACSYNNAIAQDGTGALLLCKSGTWGGFGPGASLYWKDPVANLTALNAITCNSSNNGESHMVLNPSSVGYPVMYSCAYTSSYNGSTYAWMAIGLDDSGNFNQYQGKVGPRLTFAKIDSFQVKAKIAFDTPCTSSEVFSLAIDSTYGDLLACMEYANSSNYKYQRIQYTSFLSYQSYDVYSTKYFGPFTTITGALVVSAWERGLYYIDPTVQDGWRALNSGTSLNGSSSVSQMSEQGCTGSACTATATCLTGSVISGICTGAAQDNGSAVSTTGWTCTSKTGASNAIKAVAICG